MTTIYSLGIYLLTLSSHVFSQPNSIEDCLLKKQVLYVKKGKCYPLWQQGPCEDNQVLELDLLTGEGVCENIEIDNSQNLEINCENGEDLVPRNFVEDTMDCPNGFSCKSKENCPAFTPQIYQQQLKYSQNIFIEYLEKSVTCNKDKTKGCCPDGGDNNLLSLTNLIEGVIPSGLVCSQNPCEGKGFPVMDEVEGYWRCIFNPDAVQYELAPTSKRNCGRNKIWSYGKCRHIYRRSGGRK